MEQANLTIRLPRALLEGARQYASEHNTTLTRLVTAYLRHLSSQYGPLADAPIVRRLSGALSPDASTEDYDEHLEERHGGRSWSPV